MAQHHGTSAGTQSVPRAGDSKGDTGVKDTTYNVISVVYHALQAAETIDKYLCDLKDDDAETGQFLRDAQEQNKHIAQRGRECLGRILQGKGAATGQQLQVGAAESQQGSGSRGSAGGAAGQQGDQRHR